MAMSRHTLGNDCRSCSAVRARLCCPGRAMATDVPCTLSIERGLRARDRALAGPPSSLRFVRSPSTTNWRRGRGNCRAPVGTAAQRPAVGTAVRWRRIEGAQLCSCPGERVRFVGAAPNVLTAGAREHLPMWTPKLVTTRCFGFRPIEGAHLSIFSGERLRFGVGHRSFEDAHSRSRRATSTTTARS